MNKWWRNVPSSEKPAMSEEEIQERMKELWEKCMSVPAPPDMMAIDRHGRQVLFKDLYPDYWPDFRTLREIERRLAP